MKPDPLPASHVVALGTPAPAKGAEQLHTIWAIAWPVIATLSLESLVGLADMLMVGRLGATAVAGVGVGLQLQSAINSAMFAVGTGTLAIVARHVGAGERREAEDVLFNSIFAAVGLGLCVILPVIVWAPALVRGLGMEESVVATAAPFVRRIMLGVPCEAVIFVVALGLRGAGDTRAPLLVGALVGLVNVAGGYLLIFGKLGLPRLGVTGAAWAAVGAYALGAGVVLALLGRGGLVLRLPARGLRPQLREVRRVLRVGYPAALEHLVTQVGFLLYMMLAASYGTSPVAAYAIGVRILALSFLPGFGFSAAASTLVGQHLGGGRPDHAAGSGWEATRLAIALMTAGGIVIFFAARPIARLFADDPRVIADTVSFIWVLAVAQPLMAIDFTLGGALRGAGDTRFPLLSVLAGFYVFRLGLAYVVTLWLHLGVFWLWSVLIADYLVRSALKVQRFRSGRWKLIRV